VIAIQHDHAVFFVEMLQSTEDVAVSCPDVFEMGVFPELVAIASFDIDVAVKIIIGHRILVDGLVAGKFIGQAVVAPMAVGKKIRRDVSSNSRTLAFW